MAQLMMSMSVAVVVPYRPAAINNVSYDYWSYCFLIVAVDEPPAKPQYQRAMACCIGNVHHTPALHGHSMPNAGPTDAVHYY